MCSSVLTIVLAGAGDLAEAERAGAAGLARARDAGDLWNQAVLLPRIVDLDLRAGRTGDAAAHLREGLRLAVRTGSWFELLIRPVPVRGAVRRDRPRRRGPDAVGRVRRGRPGTGDTTDPPWFETRREEQLRQARQALGPGRARAAEDRGAAMSLATAAEYALMLTDPGPPQRRQPGLGSSAPGNGSWSPWSPRAGPTRRSPPSCTSASAPSARTWTGSGTRPAAAAAPT